jgi:hypothetical protein
MTDTTPSSVGPVDASLIENLVAASRILAHHGVLDAWGHVSMRHPGNPQRYLMSRARATGDGVDRRHHGIRPRLQPG